MCQLTKHDLNADAPGVPERFPGNTVPIVPFSLTKQITGLPNRKFSVKITQMPLAPAIAATTYKLQGKTCKGVVLYSLNEPGRQRTSLYVAASRVTTLKGLFLCEKLTEDDFKYFRPSQ